MTKKRPNVVFIMTDQQRADMVGEGKHPNADFPNLEKLREESVQFTKCYTAAMACVPSRTCYLTGQQSWQNKTAGNARFTQGGNPYSWMSVLRENGYRCVSVGKTHEVHAGSHHIQVPQYKSYGDMGAYGQGGGFKHYEMEETEETKETFFDFATVHRAEDALDRLAVTSAGPFAMFVGFHGPHEPYTMPKEYMDTYSPDEVLLPAEVNENTKNAKSQCYKNKVESLEKKFGPATDEKTRTGIAGYLNLMKIIDDCVGQLLEKLKEMDLLENTLVVFSSDHGEMLGEYGIFGKGATFHEAEVRIPLMMRFPDGKEAGTVRNGLVSTIDWNPTLYDYLDIKPDFGMPGKSVMPMVENNEAVRDHVLCGCQGLMIRNEKYKLWHNPGTQDGEMYDLENDPDEMNNLYNEESFSDLKSKLLKDMLEARMDDDRAIAQLTSKDRRLLEEVCASHEPQVIAWPKS